MNIQYPDYAGGGIVNLMQSIATACGSETSRYPELIALPALQLAAARHIVLLVVDGLGQSTLLGHPACPNLQRHLVGEMSSVFPSTTASAITTFMSGLAPAQHGLTGWHMHLEEIDQTLSILPLTPRSGTARAPAETLPPRLFDYPGLYPSLKRECFVLAPKHIAGSPFNAWHARGATSMAYTTLSEMFGQLNALLINGKVPRFIYAYYPDLDTHSHRYGTNSPQAAQTLAALDRQFGRFMCTAQGSDSWIIATADHGFIDSPADRIVSLDDHPQLAALLVRPLCGERRAAYCYVAAENRPAFEAYVRQHLGHCTALWKSSELAAAGWFGPPPHHPRLAARIGDYTLLMKDNWTIKDWLPGEKRYTMLGVHGGTSDDEMRVPLIALHV